MLKNYKIYISPQKAKIFSESKKNTDKDTEASKHNPKLIDQIIKRDNSNLELREKYANRVYIFVCIWSTFIGLLILFQGFNWFNFKISNKILLTLLGTTFVEVIGLFVIIMSDLFPNGKHK